VKIKIYKNAIFRICLALFITLKFCNRVNGQAKNNWYYFRDKKTGLVGYKDVKGNIKIPAKFGGLTNQLVFSDVIAVYEDKTGKSYYLLKNGKKFGIDSLYVWDNSYDYINEGKIRFRDKKTDKVGFFDKTGKIIIPALYNDARPFHNGLALTVHNGKRVCLDGSIYNDKEPCEDWSWNGVSALIDTHNKIIADKIDITETDNIDWYAVKITNSVPDTTLYTSFKTTNGTFYSFLNYEKEFKNWFYKSYLNNLNYQALSTDCYDKINFEDTFIKQIRNDYSKSYFLQQYESLLYKLMRSIKAKSVETNIFHEDLNPYIFAGKSFSAFYINGEPDGQKYPVFNVVTTNYTKTRTLDYQNQFSFIRTHTGYKLIGVALGMGRSK